MKTAVIYARYSSDSQTEQSIEGQLRVCKEFAERNDIFIVDTYIDKAMTGTNDNRPDFQRMLKDASKKEWDYVLVYKLDRFSRDKYETVMHKHELKKFGVKVISAMENIPDTPEGIILEGVIESMNEYYSKELSQKIKRGMKENRIKGIYQGGGIPYGYKVVDRKLVIDENLAEIVKFIFNEYLNGKYAREIAEELNNKGIFKNNKIFFVNTIFNILNQECYTGIYRKDGEIFDNMYPQIISQELFNKVKAKRRVNQLGKQSLKTVYLLRNKLVCGYCGKPISSECGRSKMGKKINYYKCTGRKKFHNNCIKKTVRQDVLEKFIVDLIIGELNKPENINIIVNKF